jgi:hypothetical protein
MRTYKLNGHTYHGVESKMFRKYLDWIDDVVGIAELLNNLRAAIIMDIDYADIVTFRKNKTTISANYDEYVEVLDMIKEKCIREEWYEECQIVEDLKELRIKLYVLDFLKENFEREEISHIQDDITEKYDIYFKDLFEDE